MSWFARRRILNSNPPSRTILYNSRLQIRNAVGGLCFDPGKIRRADLPDPLRDPGSRES